MKAKFQTVLALATAVTLMVVPVVAQSEDSKSKIAMEGKDKMAMDKMSKEDKAAMFDKMSDADKMMATKMAGHDMTKMKAKDRMAMTDKMSVEDKAMMYDKMAMAKHDKMDKGAMDKDKMKK